MGGLWMCLFFISFFQFFHGSWLCLFNTSFLATYLIWHLVKRGPPILKPFFVWSFPSRQWLTERLDLERKLDEAKRRRRYTGGGFGWSFSSGLLNMFLLING